VNFNWLTDIHLEFLSKENILKFLTIISQDTSGIFITGDISTYSQIDSHLKMMGRHINVPIYFVLGNHDYYGGDIESLKENVRKIARESQNLFWLPQTGIVELTKKTCLLGHGSWADGRFGNYAKSPVILNDYVKIKDFLSRGGGKRLGLLNQLGDEAANYLKDTLSQALNQFDNVILLTHVPPFREACWHNGKMSNENFLPHFACKAVGDVLFTIMAKNPDKELTVLCGHTHSSGRIQILPNLFVKTGGAEYGHPVIQEKIQVL